VGGVTFDDKELLEREPLIDQILIPSDAIQRRVAELGREISADYQGSVPILVSILKGAVVFLADLMRQLSILHEVDFMCVSSYGGGTKSTGVVKIIKDLNQSITGRDVLIVEDIVDTGLTLAYLKQILEAREPRSIKLCTLLNKVDARKTEVPLDYVGFDIPNEFVIGYGLDWDEKFRHLPFLGILKG
jgi:hypoxanthine phosphoribosyltransferase